MDEEKIKKLQQIKQNINKDFEEINNELDNWIVISKRLDALSDSMVHSGEEIDRIGENFAKATKLKKLDIAYLFLAVGLQAVRQYFLTNFKERLNDKEAAEKVKKGKEEHSNRSHRLYNPSLEEIITNPVPFDANNGSNGALKGGGSMGHRVTALGHDPIIGLVIGTANIATSTLTNNRGESFHISTSDRGTDCFSSKARTDLVLRKTYDKLINESTAGKSKVGTSLCKEFIHLRSDVHSKKSLPIPFISYLNPKLASQLAEWGFDMANIETVGKQAAYAVLINSLIAITHAFFYDESVDGSRNFYEIRTRKILSYSNVIASSSNVLGCIIAAAAGHQKEAMKYLDIGGLIVTIHRVATDRKFICEMEQEFLLNQWNDYLIAQVRKEEILNE